MYKIAIYAICKNEEKFVDRFMNAIENKCKVYVLDTGSTDNTIPKLIKRGAIVKQKTIDPWRFDTARNEALNMIPSNIDICICLDLDEVISENFIEIINSIWEKDTTRLRYNYNWKLDNNNKPIVNFYLDKIHKRNGYKWTHPVHEILTYEGIKEKYTTTDLITVNHYPDIKKSRKSYLKLLELSVKEDPEDDRNMHYLGREYMYYKKWNKSIDTLIHHLNLKKATWKDERSASMRFISRCYISLRRYNEAEMWLLKAIEETPYLRDPYVELALLKYKQNKYNDVYIYLKKALKIKMHKKTYINEPFSWDHTIYDLLSVSCFYLEKYNEALKYVNKALKMTNDKRIKENKEIIIKKIKDN